MRDTLLDEIEALAVRWDRNLEWPANKAQVASWLDDFGKEPDDVIRLAFIDLRRTCTEKWPTYGQVRAAISGARIRVRAGVKKSADVCTDADQIVRVSPGALQAAVGYAMIASRRGDLDSVGVAETIESILKGEVSQSVSAELRAVMAAPAQADEQADAAARDA